MTGLEIVEERERMRHDRAATMREQLQHLQQLIYSWRHKNGRKGKKKI